MLNYTDFSFALPRVNELPLDDSFEQAEDYIPDKNLEQRKILVHILAADRDTRFLLGTILKMWDFEVTEAENTAQTIKSVECRCPDIVLMDTVLVIRESFAEMRKLKKNELLADTPFILLSGHAQKEVHLMALAAGAAECLVKPLDLDLLEKTLKSNCYSIF